MGMNPLEFQSKPHNIEQKTSEHLKVLAKAWKQLFQLYRKNTDAQVSIVKADIGKAMLYEFAQMCNINHTLGSEDITFVLQFHEDNIPAFLRAIRGSDLMKNLFSNQTNQFWNIGSKELTFQISESENISMGLEYDFDHGLFHVEIDYTNIKKILVQIPDAFPILVLMTQFVGIKK
jgi:hypothetical protein